MMEIIIPDMGHGNCIGIIDRDLSPLLIDCGSDNNKINNFTNLIKHNLENAKSRDLTITHYHFDHYSLLGTLPRNFFDNIYLPALPLKSSTARAMLSFLALAVVTQYPEYYLIPLILTHGVNICPKVKGTSFDAIGREWDVLWPDYDIIDKRNTRKIKTIFGELSRAKEKLNEEQVQELDKWYTRLSQSFSEEPKRIDFSPEEISESKQIDARIHGSLRSIEKVFKDLADRSSLVVEDALIDFLFTGDVDDTILNNHLNFGDHRYFLIEVSHHGGHYGSAFNNVSTEVLVISRKVNYKPRCEYFQNLPWNILVDTARTGNCIIRCLT